MALIASQAKPFDPFDIVPVFAKKVVRLHSAWLIVPGLAVGLVILLVTAINGTFGRFSDVRWFSDLPHIFSRHVPQTPPRVPLLRDAPDIILFLLVVAGLVLLHLQWKYIADCMPALRKMQVITPRAIARSTPLTRLLWMDRFVGDHLEGAPYEWLDRRLARIGLRFRLALVGFVLLFGLGLAFLLRHALDQNVLRVFVPTDLSPAAQKQWLDQARDSWWASSAHPAGYVLYGVIMWFGLSLIVAYNVMGVITVYIGVAVYLVSEPAADWHNRDGRYGWRPMAEVYRTVYWTIVLFGAVISILVALLGSHTPIAVIGLAALYALLLPVYTLVPWLIFRRIEKQAREHRQRKIEEALEGTDENDFERAQLFVAEFARIREARIQPMSIGRIPFSGFASVVLLPIGLTLLQAYLPIGFG